MALLAFIATALVLQPQLEKLHAIGRGSDQGACVMVGASRLLALQWPFDLASMFSHNPMSCGPGWIMLHAPFLSILSYPISMLIIILGCICGIAVFAGIDNAARFMVLNAVIPGTWLFLADGNDFMTFGFCIVAITVAVGNVTGLRQWILSIFTVLVSQFRLPFIFLPLFFAAGASRRRLTLGAISMALNLAIWFTFYFINPHSFLFDGPMHVLRKFQGMSGQTSPLSMTFSLLVGIGLLAAIYKLWEFPDSILVYASVVLWPLSILDLYEKFEMYHGFSEAFGHW